MMTTKQKKVDVLKDFRELVGEATKYWPVVRPRNCVYNFSDMPKNSGYVVYPMHCLEFKDPTGGLYAMFGSTFDDAKSSSIDFGTEQVQMLGRDVVFIGQEESYPMVWECAKGRVYKLYGPRGREISSRISEVQLVARFVAAPHQIEIIDIGKDELSSIEIPSLRNDSR
jgi:hypothetical protein